MRGLTKRYGDVCAVSDVSFDVRQGEILGLVGPNGAGKTTTMMCIARLRRPSSGTITLLPPKDDGIEDTSGRRPELAVAGQQIGLYPSLSTEVNLRFRAELAGLDRNHVDERFAMVVEMLRLTPLLPKEVRSLSVGQQRLVHVAAAVVPAPRLLLVDEPTAGLDIVARDLLLRSLTRLASDGTAVVFSSHNLAEVEGLCERVVVLHSGGVVASGAVRDLVTAHGGGRIELEVDGEVLVTPGEDLAEALAALKPGARPVRAEIISSSLEAVFVNLTGLRVGESGEAVA